MRFNDPYPASPGPAFAHVLHLVRTAGCLILGAVLGVLSISATGEGARLLTGFLGALLAIVGLTALLAAGRTSFWSGTLGCAIAGVSTYLVSDLMIPNSFEGIYYLGALALGFVMVGSLMQWIDHRYRTSVD